MILLIEFTLKNPYAVKLVLISEDILRLLSSGKIEHSSCQDSPNNYITV